MKDTKQQFEHVIAICRDLFSKKLHDYGPAWRILRPASVTDQIFIKANRIRSIETKGVTLVDEGIRSEFIAIVNYGIIGLIQLELGYAESADMTNEEAMVLYDKYAKEYMNEYMKSDNFKLLLVHYPELFMNRLKDSNIDLSICGHAHGGQMILPFIGSLYAPDQGWFPKMTNGLHNQKNGSVIINRGLGTHTKKPRINNVPE